MVRLACATVGARTTFGACTTVGAGGIAHALSAVALARPFGNFGSRSGMI